MLSKTPPPPPHWSKPSSMSLRTILHTPIRRLAACSRHASSTTSRLSSSTSPAPGSPLSQCFGRQRIMGSHFRALTTLPRLPILEAVASHDPASTAVIHSASGRRFTYGELLGDVGRARDQLREARGGADLDGERIAFLVENSYDYVGECLIQRAY